MSDKDGTPTYTHDFAKNVKALLVEKCWGLYNMVCGGQTSRLEVAEVLLEILGAGKNKNYTGAVGILQRNLFRTAPGE